MKALTLYNPWAWAMGRFKWNEFLAEAIEEGYLSPKIAAELSVHFPSPAHP